jgi:hypothetical protein
MVVTSDFKTMEPDRTFQTRSTGETLVNELLDLRGAAVLLWCYLISYS